MLSRLTRHISVRGVFFLSQWCLSAQTQNESLVLAPHKPIPLRAPTVSFPNEQPEARSMVGGPWLLDPSMKSTSMRVS